MAPMHPLIFLFMIGCVIQILHAASSMSVPPKKFDLGTSLHGCDEDVERKSVYCGNRGFDSVPQNLPEDIEGLVLWENNITSILSTSFKRYPLLIELILSVNNIRVIESTAFYPLKNLIRLEIKYNVDLVLPAGLFRWTRKLVYLDMSVSWLKLIPNDILKWSPKLDSVNLKSNMLTVINISSCGIARHVDLSYNSIEKLTVEAFNFVCQTDTLNLYKNPIKSVDPDVIASLHVRSLVLGWYIFTVDILRDIFTGIFRSQIEGFTLHRGANLGVVPTDLFDPLRDYTLTMLNLSENNFQNLYPFVFSNLTRIKQFTLTKNYDLVTIEPNFFEGMRELRVLNLNLNKIADINTCNLSWTVNLIELNLSHNSLKTIRNFTFRGLHNLTLLDMHSNKFLFTVERNSFRDLESIQTIDLSNCEISKIPLMNPSLTSLFLSDNTLALLHPATSFKTLHFIRHLEIRHSWLQISSLWNPDRNVSLFDGMFKLLTLDMSENIYIYENIYSVGKVFPPWVFQRLFVLQKLILKECDIQNLHPQTFTGLKSLQVLILRTNRIEHLNTDLFKELGQITTINLADNLLSDLDREIFSNNPMLKTLLLSNNRLTRLEHDTFKPIYSSLSFIDLSMNSVNCNCDLRWLLHWLNHGPLNLTDGKETMCSSASLEPLRERPLLEFDPKELCKINIAIPCLSFFAVICLIFVAALVYHNRWQLRYKLFLVKLAVLGNNEMQDARDHNDYEFDVNIIFYDDDEGWIREHLRPALQEHLPQFQRNVFGDADLVWGMHYLDSVDYVVTHSYKTIMVLSRAAVRDRWFMLKFRTAMDHVSDTLTEFVFVVFLEDIPDNEIPFLTRLYLSGGRPYLYWTEDVRGQRYFWEELAKNLTINLKTNDLIPNE